MRAAAAFVLLLALAAAPASADSCITVAIDVRRAEVVALARYAGERTFVVESVLRTTEDRPAKLVAPADWLSGPCAPREPVAGQPYLVARFEKGRLAFADYEKAAGERALIEKLHTATAPAILDELERYSRGEATRDELEDWLLSAMVEAAGEGSFTTELLEEAESFVSSLRIWEPCHPELVRAIRDDELPRAIVAIEDLLPDVDTEAEFVARRLGGIADPELRGSLEDEVLEEWEETLDALRALMKPLDAPLRALPWCDHRKLIR